jgi:protein involved in polysaccharide export with SLBB domain
MTTVAKLFTGSRWLAGVVMMLLFTVAVHGQETGRNNSGPFQVGDKIQLVIEGPVHFDSTVTVRDGLYFALPNAGNISLVGVSRADAQKYLAGAVAKYMKDATVRATVLIQVGIFGMVLRPGYYSIPIDMLLSDVPTQAGGFGPAADPNKIVVKRKNAVVVGTGETQKALASGKTVDALQLSANDLIEVGEKSRRSFSSYLQIISVFVGVVGVLLTLRTQL